MTPESVFQMMPHLIDAIAGSLPPDAWEWTSTEYDPAIYSKEGPGLSLADEMRPAVTLESVLTKDKRGHVVLNLWETEHNYTNQLGVIQKVFRQGLLDRGIITAQAANFIFAGTEELFNFHLRFFERLCSIVSIDTWSTTESCIGSLFVEMKSEFIRLYTRFIDNYAASQKSMKREEKNNEEYQLFMKEMLKLRETNRQSLKDLLILPVQRTTRYHILLKDLLKSTPEGHVDRADLEQAWEAMNTLAAMVNEKKRKEEEATGLFDAYEATKHCPPILITHRRRLIMRVDAVEKSSKRDVHLVLCNDLLMLVVPTRSLVKAFTRSGAEQPFRFVRWLDLLDLEVSELSSDDHSIRITYDPSRCPPSRTSISTPTSEISQSAPKELLANTFVFMFTGQDATKIRLNFRLAIMAELRACRSAAEDPR
eukprot:jgi/Hompol1/2442/HPOL_002915-RA